jgi:serine/threonine protein kinase
MKYLLQKEIGKGAYGTVFKAIDNYSGKTVAIKYIDMEGGSESMMRVICREVKINIFLSSLKYNIYTPRLLDIYFPSKTDVDDPKTV